METLTSTDRPRQMTDSEMRQRALANLATAETHPEGSFMYDLCVDTADAFLEAAERQLVMRHSCIDCGGREHHAAWCAA